MYGLSLTWLGIDPRTTQMYGLSLTWLGIDPRTTQIHGLSLTWHKCMGSHLHGLA